MVGLLHLLELHDQAVLLHLFLPHYAQPDPHVRLLDLVDSHTQLAHSSLLDLLTHQDQRIA